MIKDDSVTDSEIETAVRTHYTVCTYQYCLGFKKSLIISLVAFKKAVCCVRWLGE